MPGELNLDKDTYTKEDVAAIIAEQNKALEANRNEVLNEAKALRAKLKPFEGLDPDKIKSMQSEFEQITADREKAEREKAEQAGNWKSVQEQLEKKFAQQLADEQSKTTRVSSFLDRSLKDAAAIAELAKHSDTPSLLLPHVLRQMKVVEEDGEYASRIIDEKGNIRISKGKTSEPMELSELIEEMKQDKTYAPAFRGSGSSGGGASKSHASGGGQTTIATDDGGQNFLKNLAGISKGDIKVPVHQ